MMFGGNEMGPSTPFELATVSIIVLAGALINAKILGEMSLLVYMISRKDAAFQEVIDSSNTVMS
jgi:hypothetical protein